jgi:hypothetical protein
MVVGAGGLKNLKLKCENVKDRARKGQREDDKIERWK